MLSHSVMYNSMKHKEHTIALSLIVIFSKFDIKRVYGGKKHLVKCWIIFFFFLTKEWEVRGLTGLPAADLQELWENEKYWFFFLYIQLLNLFLINALTTGEQQAQFRKKIEWRK